MDIEKLKTELALPVYAGMTDQEAADALNLLNRTGIKAVMTGSEMWANTDPTQFAGLTAAKRSEWLAFCAIDSHDPADNGLAHQFVVYIFTSGATITNLAAARQEPISRATELALGGTVADWHVKQARAN